MELVPVFIAESAAHSALVAGMLKDMGLDALATDDDSAFDGIPAAFQFPVRVAEEDADAARAALKERGLEPCEGGDPN